MLIRVDVVHKMRFSLILLALAVVYQLFALYGTGQSPRPATIRAELIGRSDWGRVTSAGRMAGRVAQKIPNTTAVVYEKQGACSTVTYPSFGLL